MTTNTIPAKRRGRPYSDPELQRCDELRQITEESFKRLDGAPLSDEQFESRAEIIAAKCNGDFSPENWKRNC